jgi:TPR repeat protein
MRHSRTIAFLCLIAGCGSLTAWGQQDTWTDPATELTWAGRDNGSDVTWQQAADYCRNLQLAGYNNWRLPTVAELQGIYDARAHQHGVCCSDKHAVDYHVKGNLQLSEGGIDWSSSPGSAPGEKMTYIFSFGVGLPLSNTVNTTARRALCVRNSSTSQDTAQTTTHTELPANPSTDASITAIEKQAEAHYQQKNYDVAFQLYQEAANLGSANSQKALGLMYAYGRGAGQDYSQAMSWYQKAALQGLAEAQNAIGVMYQHGWGATQDYAHALFWYQKAAEQGFVPAENGIGVLYQNGWGTAQDYAQAMYWYQKAAAQGNAYAQFNIGTLYQSGAGTARDAAQAVYWYQKAAAQGYSDAQVNLGMMYAIGEGTAQDYAQAMYWFQKAAVQNFAFAQFDMGVMYENGLGTAQDYDQALSLYRKAAAQGVIGAQINLGDLYHSGEGSVQDDTQAMYWFQKAAAKGDSTAEFNLGLMYSHGWGTAQNNAQAMYWYQKSAAQGNPDAQNNIAFLQGKTTHEVAPKHSRWRTFLGIVNTLATVANTGMVAGSSLNAAEHGGGIGAVANAVQDMNSGYNTISNDNDNRNTLSTLADTLQKTQSTIAMASGSGNGVTGTANGSSNTSAVNACSTNSTYTAYINQCKNNPLSQAPCYQAAAALCQCYINADPTNSSVASWRTCVTNNTNSANALRSNAPTVQ